MGIQLYLIQLQKHPLRTKALTAGVISALNDIVAQKLSGIKKLQLRRLLLKVNECHGARHSFGKVFGWVYVGPCGHYLYMVLEKIFKGKMDNRTIAKKVLLEQVTSSPLNNLVFMMYYGLVIEGRAWAEVKSTIKKAFPAVQYSAWTFWPVVGWTKPPVYAAAVSCYFRNCCWLLLGHFHEPESKVHDYN